MYVRSRVKAKFNNLQSAFLAHAIVTDHELLVTSSLVPWPWEQRSRQAQPQALLLVSLVLQKRFDYFGDIGVAQRGADHFDSEERAKGRLVVYPHLTVAAI
jgi:hypothetical protein